MIADVLPADKVDAVKRLQDGGRSPGPASGWRRPPGLTRPIEAADVTVVRGDHKELRAAADAIRLSCATLRTIKGNLFWAFADNVAALPMAGSCRFSPR